jgi:hypothetical protein
MIDNIPAIITDSSQGMIPYGALQAELKEKHPTFRFMAAAAIIRPLYSALEFLHHHRIIHSSVDWSSVLIHFSNDRVDKILLVDYSMAYSIPAEEEMPRHAMLQDSCRAMELIEDCCGIWAMRKVPAPHAVHENEMRRRAELAEQEWVIQRNACRYFFENKKDDRHSAYGKRMLKVLAQKEMDWSRAKTNQLHNAGQLQIGAVTVDKLQRIVQDWEKTNPKKSTGKIPTQGTNDREDEAYPMMLTLGHKFLDDLANHLYHSRWDLLPRDICTKMRSLEGEVQHPWRTFAVTRKPRFRIRTKDEYAASRRGLRIVGLFEYMANYCDMYPEWRDRVWSAFAKFAVRKGPDGESLGILCEALQDMCVCSPAMQHALQTLDEAQALLDLDRTLETAGTGPEVALDGDGVNVMIAEEHHVCYHVPSGMFNVTQLHQMQCMVVLERCLADQDIRCDNFVEVRGESSIQGHYVPLSLLPRFAKALELTVTKEPDAERAYMGTNPSDFSHVSPGRVVLAHSGLVAFASVSRTGGQFSHLPTSPLDIESADPFLPTYFGDTKVLPSFADGRIDLPRPDHWVKFKRAEEIEADILRAKGRASKDVLGTYTPRPALSLGVELILKPAVYKLHPGLARALERRAVVIVGARNHSRHLDGPSRDMPQSHTLPKVGRENPGLTPSFVARNTNVLRSPPYRGLDLDQPFEPIDRQKTTPRERREFREKSKFWTDRYVPSESEYSSEDGEDDSPARGDEDVVHLQNHTAQTQNIVGGSYAPPTRLMQGVNYGAQWLASRGSPAVGGSAAASAELETELADTVTTDWGPQVDSIAGG